jgi:methionyl-tRNA formyltransferase
MSHPPVLRVLFLGMTNDTSMTILEALLAAGFDVCGVAVAAERAGAPPITQVAPGPGASLLPIANPFLARTIVQLAWERGLPLFEIRRPGAPETLAQLAPLRADVACVACFPQRLPEPLLALAPLGFLNMHPALLPAHRGPAPLFWIFRSGERTAGVTIHLLDAGLDTGDIAMQERFVLPDGISGSAVEQRCAALGGRLMVETLRALEDRTLARRPQPRGGSYEPWPTPADWRIDIGWPARRAFNFMRGTEEWGQPYLVSVAGQELALAAALGYNSATTLGQPYVRVGDAVHIQFAAGVLRAQIK